MESIIEQCKMDIRLLSIRRMEKSVVKEIMPKVGVVVLGPDIRPYFLNSEFVNEALRCLILLLPKKRRAKANKA